MSWITQHLIRNRDLIKTNPDIESDEFNDLLVIESKIKDLHKNGLLTDFDLLVIDTVADGKPLKELESALGKNRITISKHFIQICDRISYFLGGYFTDDGFMNNMVDVYKLSESEVDHIKEHMSSKFKHRLMRKNNNE